MKNKFGRAIIITGQEFEEPEVIYPFYRLIAAGFSVDIATENGLDVKGKYNYPISALLKSKNPVDIKCLSTDDYDVVVVPGGHVAPDKLRQIKEVLNFIKEMHLQNKLVASICHGPWVLISTGILKGVKATCYPSMIDDLRNAGAIYVDEPVVVDKKIITSRRPQDLPVFLEKILEIYNN